MVKFTINKQKQVIRALLLKEKTIVELDAQPCNIEDGDKKATLFLVKPGNSPYALFLGNGVLVDNNFGKTKDEAVQQFHQLYKKLGPDKFWDTILNSDESNKTVDELLEEHLKLSTRTVQDSILRTMGIKPSMRYYETHIFISHGQFRFNLIPIDDKL